MDQVAATAASGLHARMQALDMLANNLANSGTGGFKLDREFYSLFSSGDLTAGAGAGTELPVIQKAWTDFSQGVIQPTGNSLDVALAGKGFFVVNGPSGPLYTRNGQFQLSPAGELTTAEGYAVSAAGGGAIRGQAQTPIKIAPDGTVEQDGQTIGQLQVVDFANSSALVKTGNSYFAADDPALQPAPATGTTVQQGKIEASNVAPAESAVRLVALMRQFEMLQKAIAATTDMNKKALDDVARVGTGA